MRVRYPVFFMENPYPTCSYGSILVSNTLNRKLLQVIKI